MGEPRRPFPLRRIQRNLTSALAHATFVLISFIMAFPFLYLLKLSLQPDADVFSVPIELIPSSIDFVNYIRAVDKFPLLEQLLNSVIYATTTTVTTVLTATFAAYALAKLRLPGARILIIFFIGTMLLPPEIRVIPMYTLVAQLGWVNTWWGLIMPLTTTGFAVFFLYQFTITLPDELLEVARIDGASEGRILVSLILPLAKTAMATMAIYNFLFRWRGFVWPLVVTRGDVTTLSVGLSTLKTGQGLMQWNLIGAATMFLFIPSLILFLVLKRHVLNAVAYTIK